MDLYQAVKTDNCHSSPGSLHVNPDRQGSATRSIQVPACRSVMLMTSLLPRSDMSHFIHPNAYLAEGHQSAHVPALMFKEIINVAKAFGSAEGMANTVHIPFPPPEGAQESRTVEPKMQQVSAAIEGGIKKAKQTADALLVNK